MEIHTLLFYKFTNIENLEQFRDELLEFCEEICLLGRILIGKEGINGNISGEKEKTDEFKKFLDSDVRFSGMVYKEDIGESAVFTKMKVLVKDEILGLRKKIDMARKAPYISSEELEELYKSGEDFVILDTRNDYEWKVGKFRNAEVMPIKTFREFPEEIEKMKEELKGKKIITYCTGGIRCEKATAYMKEHGFEDEEIYQLKDGIITYCKKFPNSKWEGKCFVFDKRLMEDYNKTEKEITNCEVCNGKCDLYRNCRNVDCDRLVVLCIECEKKMNGCCSQKCFSVFKNWCMEKSKRNQGRKTNPIRIK